MPSSRTCLAAALMLLCGGAVQAQPEQTGWGSGYQMGTFYAGVSSGGVRLTFYCGDAAAAKANAAIKAGPYLMARTAPASRHWSRSSQASIARTRARS